MNFQHNVEYYPHVEIPFAVIYEIEFQRCHCDEVGQFLTDKYITVGQWLTIRQSLVNVVLKKASGEDIDEKFAITVDELLLTCSFYDNKELTYNPTKTDYEWVLKVQIINLDAIINENRNETCAKKKFEENKENDEYALTMMEDNDDVGSEINLGNNLKNFIEKSEKEEEKLKKCQIDLESVEILTCQHLKNEEINDFINQLKPQLTILFDKIQIAAPTSRPKITPLNITGSNIFSDKQMEFILNNLSNNYPTVNDGVETEVALPYVIESIFQKYYNFSFDEAIHRICLQEEKKRLNFNYDEEDL